MPARTLPSASAITTSQVRQGVTAPDGAGLYRALLMRLPYRVRESLDHEQREALRVAAEELRWGRHPVDIRVGLPLPGMPVYLAVFAGCERRGWWKGTFSQSVLFSNRAGLAIIGALIVSSATAIGWWLVTALQ